MQDNTPPSSPRPFDDGQDDIDLGDIEEVIDLDGGGDDDEDGVEDMEEMEEEVEVEDMAARVFTQHKGSVFEVSVSSSGRLAATGGEDDVAHVWSLDTGAVAFTCTGHKDSVTHVKFNHDGSLLATADMAGYIQVWKVDQANKIWDFETGDLTWMEWHHASNVLLAGTSEGELWLWLVPKGNARTFPSFGTPTQCGAFMHDGKRAVVGYDDGTVRVFDLKSGQVAQCLGDGMAHEAPVTAVAAHRDNTIAITGSMDATAILLNTVTGKVLGTMKCEGPAGEGEEVDPTVEVVSFCPSIPNLAVTATISGLIHIWDLSTQVSRHTIVQGVGSSRVAWLPGQPVVFVAGLDGTARSYDVRSGDILAQYTGHTKSILAMDILKDGSALVTCSDDGTARVFNLN